MRDDSVATEYTFVVVLAADVAAATPSAADVAAAAAHSAADVAVDAAGVRRAFGPKLLPFPKDPCSSYH